MKYYKLASYKSICAILQLYFCFITVQYLIYILYMYHYDMVIIKNTALFLVCPFMIKGKIHPKVHLEWDNFSDESGETTDIILGHFLSFIFSVWRRKRKNLLCFLWDSTSHKRKDEKGDIWVLRNVQLKSKPENAGISCNSDTL